MSQAEALLDGINVDDTLINSPYTEEAEPHIVIGTDRFIKVPDALKRIAVQYDHNMRTVTFDCPRYYDGRDMSTMRVYINIMCSDKSRHGYIADNVRVDETDTNMIHFDWTINRPMTDVSGSLAFLVCIRRADSNGNDVNHWNSELNTDMFISSGMESDDNFVEYEYPDIVSQLLDRMDAVEVNASKEAMQGYTDAWLRDKADDLLADVIDKTNTSLNDISNKGVEVLESIPEDYAELHNLSNEAARTKGDAVVYEASGEVIKVSDSSDDYLRGLRVFGKTKQRTTTGAQLAWVNINIADSPYLGVVCSKTEDGNILLNGTSTGDMWNRLASSDLVAGKTYTLTANKKIALNIWDATAGESFGVKPVNSDSFTFVAPTTGNYALVVENPSGTAFANVLVDIMLNEGSEGLSWEPYTGGAPSPSPEYPQELASVGKDGSVEVTVAGNNLANFQDVDDTKRQGITWSCKGGVVTAVGTSTGISPSGFAAIIPIVPGEYTVSGSSDGVPVICSVTNAAGDTSWYSNRSFSLDGTEKNVMVYCQTDNNATVNTKVYPMLNIGRKVMPWEPYTQNQTLTVQTPNGLPGIPVTSGANYTDANGRMWICDEVDFKRGVYIQRIREITIDGSRDVATDVAEHNPWRKYVWINDYPAEAKYGGLCNRLRHRGSYDLIAGNSISDAGFNMSPDYNVIYFNIGHWMTEDSIAAAVAALKKHPLTIKYVLKTPIETPLTASELAAFKYTHSNYPNTTVLNDSGAWMEMEYNVDTELFIKNTVPRPTDEQVAAAVNNYANEHGIVTGATAEEKAQIEQNKKNIVNLNTATQNAQSTASEANVKADNIQKDISRFRVHNSNGEVITLSDSAEAPLQGLKIFGKTEQRTTTGKNLLPNTRAANEEWGGIKFTNNGDGSYTLNGTATEYNQYIDTESFIIPSGTYVLSGTYNNWGQLRSPDGVVTYGTGEKPIVFSADTEVKFRQAIQQGSAISNQRFYPMIRLASISDDTYEPYTGGIPSPNPDYPQTLSSIGESVKVTACGKNLLPYPYFREYNNGNGGIFTAQDDGGVVINGTPSNWVGIELMQCAPIVKTGKIYSRIFGEHSNCVAEFIIRDDKQEVLIATSGNNFVIGLDKYPTAHSWSYTLKRGLNGVALSGVVYPVLSFEDVTAYEPRNGTTVTVTTPNGLPGIPVTSGGNYTDANGKQWICDEVDFEKGVYVQRVGKITYDGSADEVWNTTVTQSGSARFVMVVPGIKHNVSNITAKILNSNFTIVTADSIYVYDAEGCGGNQGGIIIHTKQIQTIEALKQHLASKPMTLVYELAEENRIPLSEAELAQYTSMKSHYPNTTIFNDAGAEMKVKYATPDTVLSTTGGAVANLKVPKPQTAIDAVPKYYVDNVDKKVETLKGIVKSFHSNIVQETSGELITVSDASDMELAGLKLYGKTEQRTTTGKNLFNGVLENGYKESVDGELTSPNGIYQTMTFDIPKEGVYTISFGTGVRIIRRDGNTPNLDCTQVTYTLEEGKHYMSFRNAASTVWDTSIGIMVEAGSTATAYEPYTGGIPSPNPDYPQPLESVGDSGAVSVTAAGKNLLNPDKKSQTETTVFYGRDTQGIQLMAGVTYTFSFRSSEDSNGVSFRRKSDFYVLKSEGGKVCSYTPDADIVVCIGCYFQSGVPSDFTDAQLEIGTTATAYEPYKESKAMTVQTPNCLPGIPVTDRGNYTDEDGQQWLCDEVDFEKGVYVQRVVLLEKFSKVQSLTNTDKYQTYTTHKLIGFGTKAALCTVSNHYQYSNNDLVHYYVEAGSNPSGNVFVTSGFDNTDNKIKMLAALVDPIEHKLSEIDPDTLAQYAALRTNYPNTTVYNDAGAHMDVKYIADTKIYIDNKFAELAAAIVGNA